MKYIIEVPGAGERFENPHGWSTVEGGRFFCAMDLEALEPYKDEENIKTSDYTVGDTVILSDIHDDNLALILSAEYCECYDEYEYMVFCEDGSVYDVYNDDIVVKVAHTDLPERLKEDLKAINSRNLFSQTKGENL